MSFALLFASLSLSLPLHIPKDGSLQLSPKGKLALAQLMETEVFELEYVGYVGTLSEQVAALRTLYKEKDADKAFKHLLDHAATAGQLYGLCGVYFTDLDYFRTAVERYRGSQTLIPVRSGCTTYERPVGMVIESEESYAVRLRDTSETMQEWINRHEGASMAFDIIGGAYPNSFLRPWRN